MLPGSFTSNREQEINLNRYLQFTKQASAAENQEKKIERQNIFQIITERNEIESLNLDIF